MPDGQDLSQTRLAHLQWRLGRAIGQISRRWRARLDGRMGGFGLTEARWLPLLHLARWGDGLTQKELATSLGVEGPTLVRTLDWLERQGLVERRPVPHDRRAKTVHLTPRAGTLHHGIEREAAAVRADILDGITEADLLTCLAVLERVATRLGTPPPGGDRPGGVRSGRDEPGGEREDRVGHRAA